MDEQTRFKLAEWMYPHVKHAIENTRVISREANGTIFMEITAKIFPHPKFVSLPKGYYIRNTKGIWYHTAPEIGRIFKAIDQDILEALSKE